MDPGSGWSPEGVRIEVKLQKDLFEHCVSESVFKGLSMHHACIPKSSAASFSIPNAPSRCFDVCRSNFKIEKSGLLIGTRPGAREEILKLFQRLLD
jgi:hypothetical protein